MTYHSWQSINLPPLQEKRSYEFDPEQSVGHRYDPVIVPNIPMISTLEVMRQSSFLKSLAIHQMLILYSQTMFRRLPADSFLWGYEDSFVDFAKLDKPMPFENFGILVMVSRGLFYQPVHNA